MNKILLETVSRIAKVPEAKLTPFTTLSSIELNNSIGLELVRSALERKCGVKLAPFKWSDSLADIDARLEGKSPAPPPPSVTSPPAVLTPMPMFSGVFSIGLDIEEIKNLPHANFREDDFYSTRFSAREIATAMLRPNPREHLCGTFCAKEALRKSRPELFGLSMHDIEILHEEGRPFVSVTDPILQSRFNFQVSISHTEHYAAAVVLTFPKGELHV